MKVDELEGIELDYWVAKSEGLDVEIDQDEEGMQLGYYDDHEDWQPLADCLAGRPEALLDWDFIGPIIIRDGLEHRHWGYNKEDSRWEAFHWKAGDKIMNDCLSSDLLTSYKLCIVKRKYGEVVTPREHQ